MKRRSLIFVLVVCVRLFNAMTINAQIVSTWAGGGRGSDDGHPATAAYIYAPCAGFFDKHNNYYFTSAAGNKVYKISNAGIISVIAGTGTAGYSGDGGSAKFAQVSSPGSIILDMSENIYIADYGNYVVRKIDATSGIITTIAGDGTFGFKGDGGPATAASLKGCSDICIGKFGDIYLSDPNNSRVRKINSAGIISTYAGNGNWGTAGDGGQATNAEFKFPGFISINKAGDLFVADNSGFSVRKVDANTGIVNTFAGTTTYSGFSTLTYRGAEIPATDARMDVGRIAIDKFGNLFITDQYNLRVYYVDTRGVIHDLIGNGATTKAGDGIMATSSSIYYGAGIAFDSCNNVYIPEINYDRIRKITYSYCNYLSVPETIANETALSIYPNPATEELHINDVRSSCSYMLYNTFGQAVAGGALKQGNNTVVMQYLSPGIYVLYITDEAGRKQVHRVVKGN